MPIVLIPARLSASRLPGKPLADIHGQPMIVHVWQRAMAAGIGPVVVAAADAQIVQAVEAAGGQAILVADDVASGSDRIQLALQRLDPEGRHDIVVNLQGDLPTIDPAIIADAARLVETPQVDIGTVVAAASPTDRDNPNVVKVAIEWANPNRGRAIYFSRTAVPWGDGPLWHHIGIYAYRRSVLNQFVGHPPAQLELRERLEQLRALTMGMRIDVALVNDVPLGVDTPADLDQARRILGRGTP